VTNLRSQKQERDRLARSLRASGTSWVDVAAVLRQRYRVNARVAFRYAHGWSQRRAADEWNKRWPDELKTFKNFSYWEQWPGSTGHAPSFDNLSKLAELYECATSDLLVDLPDFRHLDNAETTSPKKRDETAAESVTLAPAAAESPAAVTVNREFGLHPVEPLRQGLHEALSAGAMAEASLDDWEQTVIRHGRATRDCPAGVLLGDLSIDLVELNRALHRHRSASVLRRLTRVAAHMSGLMCLTLCKLDDRPAFRRWARTARLAASEAGDPVTHSWILAQEAYGHYYSGNLLEAVAVARHAQALAPNTPCVGAVLAAALEARAQAAMGHHKETRDALSRAEVSLSYLDGEALSASAFGYNEAQLRFHEGNAYTHLHDVPAALKAQDRALELCAPGDYTDWAMTRLDRARCITDTGDMSAALAYAIQTLTTLTEPQRQGIITLRGHEVLNGLPRAQQILPAARDLRDLLMLTTE